MTAIDRRKFIIRSAFTAAGLAILPKIMKAMEYTAAIDISVSSGTNAFANTLAAIEQLGGIGNFVPKGSKVGLLINAPIHWKNPGSYVNTDVVLAILKLLNEAGIDDIIYLNQPSTAFYSRSDKSPEFQSIIDKVRPCSGHFRDVEVNGAILKKASVIDEMFTCDKIINVPIIKHHAGTLITGCLKNFMGACKSETNQSFHEGPNKTSPEGDAEHLSQCVAEVNLLRKADLYVTDAMLVLKTNGPFGPGEIITPNKVFAGTNPVTMDAFGSTLLGYRPEDIQMLQMAGKLGLGSADLSKVNIKEKSVS